MDHCCEHVGGLNFVLSIRTFVANVEKKGK